MADYNVASTLRSDRFEDESILIGLQSNIDNASNQYYVSLPAGFGDCLLMETQISWDGIISLTTDAEYGFDGYIVDVNGNVVDFIGSEFSRRIFSLANENKVGTRLFTDQPVMWRQVERVFIRANLQEANAADTSDFSMFFRVKRLRNTGAPS